MMDPESHLACALVQENGSPSDNKHTMTATIKTEKKTTKKKRKRRRTKKNKTTEENDDNSKENEKNKNTKVNEKRKRRKKNKGRRRRGPGEDRYYGRFRCKACGKAWTSAHVYTIGGTRKVKYRQRCKNCSSEEAWVFPFKLELIQCSVCHEPAIHCKCLCEDCGKLQHRPRGENPMLNDDDYCSCVRRTSNIGDNIDRKKTHRVDLCQRCSTGRYCRGSGVLDEDGCQDNEP